MSGSQAGRKQRITPRQLWERMERQKLEKQNGETANEGEAQLDVVSYLDVEPTEEQEEESTPDVQPASATDAEPEPDDETEDEAQNDVEVSAESEPFDTSEEPQVATANNPEPEQQPEEPQAAETPSAEQAAESRDDAAQSQKPEPKMVERDKQPGQMRYPYATHGPAPESDEEDTPKEERKVSSAFVLGIIVIVVGVLLGLALVRQHKRISRLDERVAQLEEMISAPNR